MQPIKICTKEYPSNDDTYTWWHPNFKLIKKYYNSSIFHDNYNVYRCPNCGVELKEIIVDSIWRVGWKMKRFII